MRVKFVSKSELDAAIKAVNEEHGYRLEYNREPEQVGRFLHFTIQSEKSGIPGARTSWSGRNLKSASWHAHGYLFDKLLEINPGALIVVGNNLRIYQDEEGTHNNWIDQNIGSMMQPVMFSETSIL